MRLWASRGRSRQSLTKMDQIGVYLLEPPFLAG